MTITRLDLPTIDQLRDRYVADVKRLKQRAGVSNPNVAPGSESFIRGQAVAAATQRIMAREIAVQDTQMGDSAMGDDMVRICTLERIPISTGAGASGFVLVSCSGGTTYAAGEECRSSDGLRYSVQTTIVANDGDAVPVVGIDVGKRTNKTAGTVLTWTSPPAGSESTAVVDADGLQFGVDADTTESLRTKWTDRKRHPPRGGNWAHVAEDAQNASASIQRAFVYPGIYGPSTMHVAITVAADDANAYSRIANGTLQLAAATAVIKAHPEHADLTLTSVLHVNLDLLIKLTLHEPKAVGGAGGGWIDTTITRWPQTLNAASPYAVRLASTSSNGRVLTVTSDTAPIVDAHIAIWSNLRKRFEHAQIAAVTGSGPYTITLYSAVDVSILTSGDWIMPDCEHIDEYAVSIASQFSQLGPGEKTSDVTKLPRSYRKPHQQESWPSMFTSTRLDAFGAQHSEIINVTFHRAFSIITTYTSLPIATPVSTSTGVAPYCLRLGKLGIYGA